MKKKIKKIIDTKNTICYTIGVGGILLPIIYIMEGVFMFIRKATLSQFIVRLIERTSSLSGRELTFKQRQLLLNEAIRNLQTNRKKKLFKKFTK